MQFLVKFAKNSYDTLWMWCTMARIDIATIAPFLEVVSFLVLHSLEARADSRVTDLMDHLCIRIRKPPYMKLEASHLARDLPF